MATFLIFILFVVGFVIYYSFDKRLARIENILRKEIKITPDNIGESPGEAKPVPNIPASTDTEQVFLFDGKSSEIRGDEKKTSEAKEVSMPAKPVTAQEPSDNIRPGLDKAKLKEIKKNIEFNFGGKIYTMVGVVAVILGIGFFLRYAFENNLITEEARVVMGILGGIVMIAAGWFTRKKYEKYGNVLTGGGLGILYLSLFAGFNFYQIISQPVAFGLMAAVTVLGVALSIAYDSIELAFFSQLGGFITPLLLSSGKNDPHSLFIYILLLDLGLVAVALYKHWRKLIIGGYAGTILVYLVWFAAYGYESFTISIIYSSLFYIIFLSIFMIFHFRKEKLTKEIDFLFLLSDSVIYFIFNYFLFEKIYPDYTGLFVLLLGTLHFLMFFLLYRKTEPGQPLPQYLLGLSAVFLVISLPLMFDKAWITIGWSCLGALFAYMGFRFEFIKVRFYSLAIFTISFIRMLAIDSDLAAGSSPWLNDRMLTFIVSLALYAFTCYLFKINKDKLDQKTEKSALSYMVILSALIFLLFPTFEFRDFYASWQITAFWSMAIILISLMAIAMKEKPLKYLGVLMFFIIFIKLAFYDFLGQDINSAILNTRIYSLAFVLISSISLYFIYSSMEKGDDADKKNTYLSVMLVEIYFLAVYATSLEIHQFYNTLNMPVLWAAAACAGLYFSYRLKNTALKAVSSANMLMAPLYLIINMAAKSDLHNYLPLFNQFSISHMLVIAFICGFALIIDSKEEDMQFKKIMRRGSIVAANYLAIQLISREIINIVDAQRIQAGIPAIRYGEYGAAYQQYSGIKNALLSVAWSLYAIATLAIGIIKRSSIARLLSIILFGAVIFKVFLYDTASLKDYYRFISFISLGTILLLTGYLYNRYKERITEFMTAKENGKN